MYNLTSPSHHIVQYYLPKEVMSLVILHLFWEYLFSSNYKKSKKHEAGICLEIFLPLSELKAYSVICIFNIFPTGMHSLFALYIAT